MAKFHPLALKVLFIGVPLLVAIALLPTDPNLTAKQKPNRSTLLKRGGNIYGTDRDGITTGTPGAEQLPGFVPVSIPERLAGGEPTWFFSGTASANGTQRALMTNKANGDSVFLSPGEIWKGLRLLTIDGDRIVVTSASGNNDPITLGGGRNVIVLPRPNEYEGQDSNPISPVTPGSNINVP